MLFSICSSIHIFLHALPSILPLILLIHILPFNLFLNSFHVLLDTCSKSVPYLSSCVRPYRSCFMSNSISCLVCFSLCPTSCSACHFLLIDIALCLTWYLAVYRISYRPILCLTPYRAYLFPYTVDIAVCLDQRLASYHTP